MLIGLMRPEAVLQTELVGVPVALQHVMHVRLTEVAFPLQSVTRVTRVTRVVTRVGDKVEGG
jgi:hypothetical protein